MNLNLPFTTTLAVDNAPKAANSGNEQSTGTGTATQPLGTDGGGGGAGGLGSM